MSFLDHIKELVYRLRMILYSVIISSIAVMFIPVGFDFTNISAQNPFYTTITSYVITNLQNNFLPEEAELLPMSFLAPLEVYVFVSLILGVIISLPVISYELYRFINPALYVHEKKAIYQFVASFFGLFVFGFVLGYFLILPASMRMLFLFTQLLDLPPIYEFATFFSLVGFTLLLCGLLFTFPTYIVLLVKAGIVKVNSLTKNRRYLYGGLIVAIAILDPEPGLLTEALVFIPLVILTEISIAISKRIERDRDAREQPDDSKASS
ncbi:MAG: twin-arginine translocase subunit TatC [Candidatus Bathyarchaeia archaeon]